MNVELAVREALRITWKTRPLWALGLVLFAVYVPTSLLAGGLAGTAAMAAADLPGPQPAWLRQLRLVPFSTWVGIAAAAVLVLIVTTCIAWVVQAALMRGVAMAADQKPFTVSDALRLGRRRIVSLVVVSAAFSAVILPVALLPSLLVLADPRSPYGPAIMRNAQVVLSPLNIVMGFILLFVMLAIALEDLSPPAAFRRGWAVFRAGWWAFLAAIGGTMVAGAIMGVVIGILLIPILFAVGWSVVFQAMLGWTLAAAGVLVLLAVTLPAMLWFTVFTIALYTLIYRQAAQRTAAAP